VPGLATVEEPRAHRLVVVDCLTLWLTNLLMPLSGSAVDGDRLDAAIDDLADVLRAAAGPVVVVSNEIGLGLSPMSREARRFVDELGRLHQRVAGHCASVTLMVAGLEVPVKRRMVA